jgi:hypothetical protein
MIFKGKELLIDDEDKHLLDKYSWWWTTMGYLVTKPATGTRIRKTISLHRMIMGDGEQTVDHINNIKHDNRKCNLRKVSYSDNNRNYKHRKAEPSLPAGVTRYKDGKRFQVILRDRDKRLKWLGLYETIDEAGVVADNFLESLAA